MIYLYTALYPEAKHVIRHFGLKRRLMEFGFDVFEGDGLRLILTGTGSLAAATAVGSSLAFFHAGRKDFLVNWGCCAAEGNVEAGTVFLCHALFDRISGNTFYPDMIVFSTLPEAAVVTEPGVWSAEDSLFAERTQDFSGRSRILHDMEAAAVYFAGSYFLSPDRMHFIKLVSDHGAEKVDESYLSELIRGKLPLLLEYLEQLRAYGAEKGRDAESGLEKECPFLENLYEELHCSQAMKQSLLQLLKYCNLAGVDYEGVFQEMRASGEIPCRDRREGKRSLENLKQRILFERK